MSSASPDFTFYNKQDYLRQLVHDIGKTKHGDRVLLVSMNFNPDESAVAAIVDALCAAAARGVVAHLSVDARDFISIELTNFGPLWFHDDFPHSGISKTFSNRLAAIEKLRAHGVVCGISNQPHRKFSSPVHGRSHIKAGVINNMVFVGGCNFWHQDQLDLMVGWHDAQTADWLYAHLRTLVDTESTRETFGGTDLSHAVGSNAHLLIDSGTPDQSLIFSQALALIDAAREWLVITCQFFPHDVTAEHLSAAAKRGVKVLPYFNAPRKHRDFLPFGLAIPIHQAVAWRARRHVPQSFFDGELSHETPFLHSKLLASEQGAIIGSHNYVSDGVKFGTAEIALRVRDPAFAKTAVQFMLQDIGRPTPDFLA